MLTSTEPEARTSSRLSKICPAGADLAVLGRKWSFHIIRNIGILGVDRFNNILRSLPGLTPRVLIMRLNELQGSSLITPVVLQEKPRLVQWVLTEKGTDTLPIIQGYVSFMEKWHPNASLKNHLRIRSARAPSFQDLVEEYKQASGQ